MKYVSVDIETTGTNPELHKIIEFGAVIEDTLNPLPLEELPKFHYVIKSENNQYNGEAFAIFLNQRVWKILAGQDQDNLIPIISEKDLPYLFNLFLKNNGYETKHGSNQIVFHAAGKCFATFDKLFLEALPNWSKFLQITRRVIDPGILFVDWEKDDGLPNLETCKLRAGLEETQISHIAEEDALDVIKVLRTTYQK